MPGTNFSLDAVPLAIVFLAMATLIMWFSARVVGVTTANMSRAFISTLAVSLVMGAVVSAMSALGPAIGIALGVAGVIGSVILIRTIFQISNMPAFLIFVVNIMVQIILVSIYLRPFVEPPPAS